MVQFTCVKALWGLICKPFAIYSKQFERAKHLSLDISEVKNSWYVTFNHRVPVIYCQNNRSYSVTTVVMGQDLWQECQPVFFICSFVSFSLLLSFSAFKPASVLFCLLPARSRERARVWKSCHAKIKLFGTVTSPIEEGWGGVRTREGSGGGVDRSIHHHRAGLTQQKMECWVRPLGCEGPGNSKQYFVAPVSLSNKGGRYMNYLALM